MTSPMREAGAHRPVPAALRAAFVLGGCLLTYAPVFVQEYAFTDDWSHLAATDAGTIAAGPVIAGRPLYALALVLGFRAAGSLAGVAWLRLLAVLGLGAFAWVLHRHLERHAWSPFHSLAVALACIALPGPMLYASWGICFPFPWALTLGGLAFVLVGHPPDPSRRSQSLRLGAAMLLLTSSFLTYQPAAPAFWVFFAIAFFAPATTARFALSVRASLVFGASAGLGLVAVALGKALHPALAASRTTLATDPIGKVRWFVGTPLVEAWNFVGIHRSIWLAVAVGLLTAVGLALASRRAGVSPALGVAAGAALLLAAYAPNLAVAENYASFRTEAALSMVATVLAAIALREWASQLPIPDRLLTPALVAVAGAFLLTASATLQNYLVRPSAVELSWLRAVLSAPASRILVVPRPGATVSPDTVHDELGFPSITTDWSGKAQIAVILRERGLPVPEIVFPNGTNDAELRVTPGTIVVDTQWLAAMRADYRR